MSDVTTEGSRLIRFWLTAQQSRDRAQSTLNACEIDLLEAEAALAKWLTPADAKPGEKIAVWFGCSLIQVEVGGVGMPDGPTKSRVTVRTRGKHFERLREAS